MNIELQKKKMVLAYREPKDLFERAVEACKRRPPPPRVEKLERMRLDAQRCIERSFKVVDTRLRAIVETSPYLDDLHPLFRDLLLLSVDPNEYKKCAAKLASARKIIRKIYSESKRRIKSSASQAEAVKARRAFFGRTLSVLKSLENCFSTVRNVQEAFLKLPEIDTEIPSVVIAGAPNVGKSTLLRALTNAKPKVSPYPFTTKELQVGILDLKWSRVQLLDTPGLLDTPLEEKNRVELQAVLAIRHISKLILFVVDPTEMCGFPLEYQRAVYTGIAGNFPHIRQIIVLNKIDAANDEHLTRFRQVFQNLEFIGISAEKKQNLEKLIEAIEEAIEEKTRKV